MSPRRTPPFYEVDFQTCDGMWIKQITVPKEGTILPQHLHKYDHSTLLAKGAVILYRGNGVRQIELFKAPAIITIRAGTLHEFQTKKPDTLLYCLHNLHGAAGIELLAEHDIPFEDLGFER